MKVLSLAYGLARFYRFMVEQWRQGGIVQVRRERPGATGRGKVPVFRALS